jgi:hypothetical protein
MSETQKYNDNEYGFEFEFPSTFIIKPSHQGTNMQLHIVPENSNPQNGEPLGSSFQNLILRNGNLRKS